MRGIRAAVIAMALGAAVTGCGGGPSADVPSPEQLAATPWPEIEAQARGRVVHFAMWAGDEARNRFFEGPVTRQLAERYGMTLRLVPLADTADLVNKLLNERQAGRRRDGSVDLVWINGENFRTAKEGGLLWGPFADQVPNVELFPTEARQYDFGTAIDGFEAPWQVGQFVFAHDTTRVPEPPRSLADLRAWITRHPGRFTYPAPPDFTGSAFIRHVLYHAGGEPLEAFQQGFDEAVYRRASARALGWLRDVRGALWRGGDTYPATPAELDRLFVNHEVDFSMSYGPTFASERIARGEFPATTRTFVFDEGTVFNYSFLAIPFNAANPVAALVTINEFLSVDHALARVEALGGLLPFDPSRLTADVRAAAAALPLGPATLPLEFLAARRVPEADAEYLVRFERDWQREVLRR